MRGLMTIFIAILLLAISRDPALPNTYGDLARIHMVDALTGWGIGTAYYGGPAAVVDARGFVELLLHTRDGGVHWKDVTPPDPPGQQMRRVYSIDVLNSLIAWVSATPVTPGATIIFNTVDGGQTWKHKAAPDLNWSGVPPVDFINARDGWMISAKGAVYRTTDGGDTWIRIASANSKGTDGLHGIEGITFLDAERGFATGGHTSPFATIYVTRDGGYTWQQQELSPPSLVTPNLSGFFAEPPIFFTSQDGILPAQYSSPSASGIVFYTTHDGGVDWEPSKSPYVLTSQKYRGWSFADANHGWVVDVDGILYVTGDGGLQWTRISPTPSFGDVRNIDFVSLQLGWAVSDSPPWFQKTVDGGRTWTVVSYTISR